MKPLHYLVCVTLLASGAMLRAQDTKPCYVGKPVPKSRCEALRRIYLLTGVAKVSTVERARAGETNRNSAWGARRGRST